MFSHLSLGEFHPAIIHFPIALVTIGFITDLLAWGWVSKRERFLRLAHWYFIFAAIMIIPTAITGWYAKAFYIPDDPDVLDHLYMAIVTAVFVISYAIFRVYCLANDRVYSIYLFVIISLIATGLISTTAELGGIVVRGKGITLQSERAPGTPLPYNKVP